MGPLLPHARPTRAVRRAAARLALGVATALTAAAATGCTDGVMDPSSAVAVTTTTAALTVGEGTVAGTDGPVTSGASPVRGMRGVAPGLRVPSDFRAAVAAQDPQATDLIAAAAGYDAVVMIAVAAEGARTDAPGRIAANIVPDSRSGELCDDFRSCRRLALRDQELDESGRSGSLDLRDDGDPAQGAFATVEFDGTGALRAGELITTQAASLSAPATQPDPEFGPAGDGTLQIGTLLPPGGPDGAAARGALAGARIAVDELNAGGGVLGTDVVLVPDDTGDGSAEAVDAAVTRLLGEKVDAVLGGTDGTITAAALPRLTEAGIILMSPTDSSRASSVADDRGLFFRLATPADLEGQVLGNLVLDDGAIRVAIAAGTGAEDIELAADVAAAVNASGGKVTATVGVAPGDDARTAVDSLLDGDPQAVVVATDTATAASLIGVLTGMGKGPGTLPLYGTAANMGGDLVRAVGG